MLSGVTVLETDGAVQHQARLMERHSPALVRLAPPARAYRYFMPHADLPRVAQQLAAARGRVVLLGSGHFHHLTAAMLSGIAAGPVAGGPRAGGARDGGAAGIALVLIDAHAEWSLPPPGYLHCGSWLPDALALPQVRAVALAGLGAVEAQGMLQRRLLHAIIPAARAGRLRIYPARRTTAQALRLALALPHPVVCFEDGLDRVTTDLLAFIGDGPVYLSIDKDVVMPAQLPSPWGGGEIGDEELLALVHALVRGCDDVVGADVCGEYVPAIRYLAPFDPGVVLHEQFNLRLLDRLFARAPAPLTDRAA